MNNSTKMLQNFKKGQFFIHFYSRSPPVTWSWSSVFIIITTAIVITWSSSRRCAIALSRSVTWSWSWASSRSVSNNIYKNLKDLELNTFVTPSWQNSLTDDSVSVRTIKVPLPVTWSTSGSFSIVSISAWISSFWFGRSCSNFCCPKYGLGKKWLGTGYVPFCYRVGRHRLCSRSSFIRIFHRRSIRWYFFFAFWWW